MIKLILTAFTLLTLCSCATYPDTVEGRAAHEAFRDRYRAWAASTAPKPTTRTRCHRETDEIVCETE